jgi:integrase
MLAKRTRPIYSRPHPSNAGTKQLTSGKTYVDELARDDIYRFHAALRKRGCRDRTVANKHQRLTSWLRLAGIDKTILPPTPKYEEKLPTIYDRDQISTLLAEAGPYMRMAILLGLKCGLRDRELHRSGFPFKNRCQIPRCIRHRNQMHWNVAFACRCGCPLAGLHSWPRVDS